MRTCAKILTSLSIILLMACHDTGHHHSHEPDLHKHESVQDTSESGLSLNNGDPWLMDDHTRIVAQRMFSRMHADHSTLENNEQLRRLGSELTQDIAELIQGCTMTGEAHDQLHLFLNAYIPAVSALEANGKSDQLDTIKALLESYDKHFQ